MSTPETLAALARWAHGVGLSTLLRRPCDAALRALQLGVDDARLARTVTASFRQETLESFLTDPMAESLFAILKPPGRGAELRAGLYQALRDHAELDADVEAVAPPQPSAAGAPPLILQPPVAVPLVWEWANQHGVAARLVDRVRVLGPLLYGGDVYISHFVGNAAHRVIDVFAPPPALPVAAPKWEVMARARSVELLIAAARQYLHRVASARAVILARRALVDQRARPPVEPCLVALADKLRATRTELATRVDLRPIGTYMPGAVRVAETPLRVFYSESVDLGLGFPSPFRLEIHVETDPLRIDCTCVESREGPCPHALDALDGTLDMLRDPEMATAARTLAATLSIPVWQRFLRGLGEEITRREIPASSDTRLAWRILGSDVVLAVEPILQKRLKSGSWSQGGRIRLDEVLRNRALLEDPKDARVVRALGAEPGERAPVLTSRSTVARAVEVLVGHPRVYLESKPGVVARLARARLRVALETRDDGIAVSFFLGASSFDAGTLLSLTEGADQIAALDHAAGTVTLCAVDERAKALLAAFQKHPARFPPESHDDLVRGLSPLQESVELTLPEALVGATLEGDPRPVLRLSPRDSGDVDLDLLVRPVEGGPLFRPGEGPVTVLHALDGRRLTARRSLSRETASAAPVVALLGSARPSDDDDDETPSPWTFLLDEDATLDLLLALRDLGDAVVVEWPELKKRLTVGDTLSRKELRIRVLDRRDWFGVEGEVEVDGATIPLATLLEAVRGGRRYVRVAPGHFAQIEDDLRRRVSAADDVLHSGRKGLEVSLPGVAQLEGLVEDAGHLEAAVRWRELVQRLDAARALDPVLPEGLTATLRPYQIDGYRWLVRLAAWGAGACLADDMGLGKTVQTLALLLSRKARGPALVIAPTSVGPNWLRETEKFAPGLRARLYRGAGRAALLAEAVPGDLLVTSYALAVRDAEALGKVRFATLVLDEAQAIKNALTRRARAIAGIDAELRVALTGTPVENHLGELWSLMRVLTPGLLGSWEHFRDRFATPIERNRDNARRQALTRLVRPFLLRRTKAEVAPELPPRTEIERFVDLSAAERRLYDDARRAALETLASGEGDARFAIFAALTRLRRLACHPRLLDDGSPVPSSKLTALLEIVEELREEGHRALVFSQFTSHLGLVREALERAEITYEYLDGSTPSEERTRRIDTFQGGKSELFLISLKAGGTGLNLTAADYVIHLDPWWNPAVEDQATDRAHRIGQTKAVTVIRLVARGTIEEAVLGLHKDKRALAASVFDEEGSPARLSAEELAALIRAGMGESESGGDEEGDAAGDEVVGGAGEESGERGKGKKGKGAAVEREVRAAVVEAPKVEVPKVETVIEAPKAAVVIEAPKVEVPKAEGMSVEALSTAVIAYLAKARGVEDPRYDATLRTYARALRRFGEYLAAGRGEGEAPREVTEGVMDDYLAALAEGRWPAPASEAGIARSVMNHAKAYLRRAGR